MNSKISNILLSPTNSLCNLNVSSKKALFETIAKHIYKELHSESWEAVFDALISREKLGTTGFGDGIAIPHCRLNSCTQATALFTKLNKAINFDAIDGEDVDLVFALIVPEHANDEHLEILSKLAAILDNNACRIALRDCNNDSELFKRITKMLSG
jgi:PTS system nitrogen regulatory IIA component